MVSFKELRGFLRDVRIAHHIRGRIRLKLDGRVVSIDVPRVEAGAFQTLLDRTPGVRSVHDLHIWTLSSNRIALSAHLVVESLVLWPETLAEARQTLRLRGIVHVTLQPEPAAQPVLWQPLRSAVGDDSPL